MTHHDDDSRTRLSVEARRAQLVALGLALFSQKPYEDVSVDDIAHAAGISKGLLYHYFGSKRGLYVASVQAAADQLEATALPDLKLAPPQRLAMGLAAYFDFAQAHAPAYVALMRSGIGVDKEIAQIVQNVRDRFVARLLEGAGVSQDHAAFRLAARSWIGAVEAASLDWIARRDLDRDALLHLLTQMLAVSLSTASALDPTAPVDLFPLRGQVAAQPERSQSKPIKKPKH